MDLALRIDQKSEHTVWQTGTSDFSKMYIFPQFDQKPYACGAKSFITVFPSWKDAAQ
jgi:hypothetical protein